jgi:hypothetical protein
MPKHKKPEPNKPPKYTFRVIGLLGELKQLYPNEETMTHAYMAIPMMNAGEEKLTAQGVWQWLIERHL